MNAALFLHEIRGNAQEPVLRGGDFVLCTPCDRYSYERMYVLNDGEIVLAQRRSQGVIATFRPNKIYPEQVVSADWFNANVRGAVVAEVALKVTPSEFGRLAAGRGFTGAAPLALEAA